MWSPCGIGPLNCCSESSLTPWRSTSGLWGALLLKCCSGALSSKWPTAKQKSSIRYMSSQVLQITTDGRKNSWQKGRIILSANLLLAGDRPSFPTSERNALSFRMSMNYWISSRRCWDSTTTADFLRASAYLTNFSNWTSTLRLCCLF